MAIFYAPYQHGLSICGKCGAAVHGSHKAKHTAWHDRLSPAPTREDASGSTRILGVPRATEDALSRGRDRILDAARRQQEYTTCEHAWPPEITPYSQCEWCGLPYKDWREEHEDEGV